VPARFAPTPSAMATRCVTRSARLEGQMGKLRVGSAADFLQRLERNAEDYRTGRIGKDDQIRRLASIWRAIDARGPRMRNLIIRALCRKVGVK